MLLPLVFDVMVMTEQAPTTCGAFSQPRIIFLQCVCQVFFCDIRDKSAVFNVLRQNETIFDIQVGFLAGPPLIVLSVRLDSKSHQKGSQCQNFLRVWHLFVFWADQ